MNHGMLSMQDHLPRSAGYHIKHVPSTKKRQSKRQEVDKQLQCCYLRMRVLR
eukprot:m.157319 g.157319  ORF g.157319 m.157319 type:complete len:52 (+) comp16449_c0_seq40:1648-1803(+)